MSTTAVTTRSKSWIHSFASRKTEQTTKEESANRVGVPKPWLVRTVTVRIVMFEPVHILPQSTSLVRGPCTFAQIVWESICFCSFFYLKFNYKILFPFNYINFWILELFFSFKGFIKLIDFKLDYLLYYFVFKLSDDYFLSNY